MRSALSWKTAAPPLRAVVLDGPGELRRGTAALQTGGRKQRRCCLIALCLVALAPALRADIIHVEAEQWTNQGGGEVRVLERTVASNGKTVSYWEEPGVWLEYIVSVPRTDSYLLSLGYALNWPDTVRRIAIDGEPLEDVSLPTTGSWNDFAGRTLDTLRIPPLKAGQHTLRFTNADSRGLSLDWFSLHTADEFPFDRALTDAEQTALLQTLFQRADSIREDAWKRGEICLDLAQKPRNRLELKDYILATPTVSIGKTTTAQTENLAILCTHTTDRLTVWLTDGKTLWTLVISHGDASADLPLPVLGENRRLVTAVADGGRRINLTDAKSPAIEAEHIVVGSLHVTAAPSLQVAPGIAHGDVPMGMLRLHLQPWGKLRVGATRYSLRWGRDAPRVGLQCNRDSCVVRETQQRFPTLARFYGEAMFDANVSPAGDVALSDLRSGQTVRIGYDGG